MTGSSRVRSIHSLSTSDLLHRVRASVDDMRYHARAEAGNEHALQQQLEKLLHSAMCAQSPSDIAVALGCAAELQLFPDQAVLDSCTETICKSDVGVLRAMIWTVRHRYARHRQQVALKY